MKQDETESTPNEKRKDAEVCRGTRPPDWSPIFNRDPMEGISEAIYKSAMPVFDPKLKGEFEQIIVFGTGGEKD